MTISFNECMIDLHSVVSKAPKQWGKTRFTLISLPRLPTYRSLCSGSCELAVRSEGLDQTPGSEEWRSLFQFTVTGQTPKDNGSIPLPFCTGFGSKWHRQCTMAAVTSGTFWLHFCSVSLFMSVVFRAVRQLCSYLRRPTLFPLIVLVLEFYVIFTLCRTATCARSCTCDGASRLVPIIFRTTYQDQIMSTLSFSSAFLKSDVPK